MDEGIDLIIEISDGRIGVKCKRYSGKISVSTVQEAYAKKDMHDCDKILAVTNSYFTAPAVKMAEKINVVLWDHDEPVTELLEVQILYW
ncbi:restriction endonuclease [Paenibacillus farraposensis]|uniref:restriction endonuclease n=1 Tax=Paenibacillus farraposensis TaxID=2807095 RepID=UPI00361F2869